ncbi:hypothetical protein HanXRQr2_Chr04g0157341 [Helianthus annuus]|uniref:Uncharacterized protein n=1 Tax=Helianthus annuus TaxID=4232 RepID=A0A251TNN8_HELAN|nr:hypothetical protein HanXRQr2_Chr04g0157341 [Helianthus annuus]KAJ0930619.1 hypothetical protein HanPSC8_Chr04g0151461 [Helianthus annuus]
MFPHQFHLFLHLHFKTLLDHQNLIFLKYHPPDHIIGNISEGVLTRSQSQNICLFAGFFISPSASQVPRGTERQQLGRGHARGAPTV